MTSFSKLIAIINKVRSISPLLQLQKELGHEKKKMTELKESHSLEQRRVKQRVNHMEQEIVTLKKQLHSAQQLIDVRTNY